MNVVMVLKVKVLKEGHVMVIDGKREWVQIFNTVWDSPCIDHIGQLLLDRHLQIHRSRGKRKLNLKVYQ
ncbi:hypothetical protein P5673_009789 [Acropora cervicornis]|uniref:Uncharacterized protein n=1 Tax=Acropora cervicornis TaxID=6130 RepID=A0AAD9VA09_ACRCE|nr:hypothetical protein P5673_009789 [Acropora cervicornis]